MGVGKNLSKEMRTGGKNVVLIRSDTITWLKYYYAVVKEWIKNKVWIII